MYCYIYWHYFDATVVWNRLKKMAEDVSMRGDLQAIGDEWAPREHTMRVIADCIHPYVQESFVVGEIGVGGGKLRWIWHNSIQVLISSIASTGRIASEVYHMVKHLHCFDISQEMIKQAKSKLQQAHQERDVTGLLEDKVSFHLVTGSEIDLDQSAGLALDNHFDFLYSWV